MTVHTRPVTGRYNGHNGHKRVNGTPGGMTVHPGQETCLYPLTGVTGQTGDRLTGMTVQTGGRLTVRQTDGWIGAETPVHRRVNDLSPHLHASDVPGNDRCESGGDQESHTYLETYG